jgi:hypothetical protein
MQAQTIPYGYCHCGCGQKTKLATKTSLAQRGLVKGEPQYFLNGHHTKLPRGVAWDRFLTKVKRQGDGCWLWTASLNVNGYAQFWNGKRMYPAHRFAYERLVGSVPDGLQLDHLCRVRHCVNPDHLEPVTNRENVLRGKTGRLKTHCAKGHPWIPENLYVAPGSGRKFCRMCVRQRAAA